MTQTVLSADKLSKSYEIGAAQQSYRTIRESLVQTVTAPFRALAQKRRGGGQPKEDRTIWALRDISFEIKAGEVVGVIGRNGAGKSTLLKILSRITEPSSGEAHLKGRVGSLLEVGTGFHGELTGRENILLNGAILGMRRTDVLRQFDQIVAFSEIEKFIDTPVKHYSTGMYMRLAFAVAAHLEPEILLIDEVLAVGDMAFQKKCLGRVGEVAAAGRTVLFVSHNMAAIKALCTKGLVLHRGEMDYFGAIGKSIEHYFRLAGGVTSPEKSASITTGFAPIVVNGGDGGVEQDERMEVTTTVTFRDEVPGFTLVLLLEDSAQRGILNVRVESGELKEGPWKGSYDLRVELPALWLQQSIYTLYFKMMVRREGPGLSRILSDVCNLEVSGRNLTTTGESILAPDAEWSASPVKVSSDRAAQPVASASVR